MTPYMPYIIAIAALVVSITALLLIKMFLFRLAQRRAAQTVSDLDDILLAAVSTPANLVVVVVGFWLAHLFVPMPERFEPHVAGVLSLLLISAVVLFVDRLIVGFYDRQQSKSSNVVLKQSSNIIHVLIHSAVFGLGGLVILDSLGISITPLIASLGIGSLAVALALQDTLANLFAGIHLVLDRPIEAGDFLRLESGDEGHVEKIGWRTTQLRTNQNNMVIIPNNRLANSCVTNYSRPQQQMTINVDVGVAYNSDLKKVEVVTKEVARRVQKESADAVSDYEPLVRFHTFADSSINLTVTLSGRDFIAAKDVQHAFIKALHERFRQDGINIPFPMRTLEINEPIKVNISH